MTIPHHTFSPNKTDDAHVFLHEDGMINISGPDAERFLQGQLTCDIQKATQAKLMLGAHCNPQGRIISLFYLFLHDNAYFLLMPRNLIPIAIAALKKYSVFFRVEIKDISADKIILGATKQPHEASIDPFITLSLPFSSTRWISIGNNKAAAARLSASKNVNLWKYMNICEGIPTIYASTSGLFLPHEINLPQLGAIDFDKGCYTGQEIIARMHYRGKLKKQMYHASICAAEMLAAAQAVYSRINNQTQIAGYLIDCCQAPQHDRQHALIILNDNDAIDHHLFLEKHKDDFFTIE